MKYTYPLKLPEMRIFPSQRPLIQHFLLDPILTSAKIPIGHFYLAPLTEFPVNVNLFFPIILRQGNFKLFLADFSTEWQYGRLGHGSWILRRW